MAPYGRNVSKNLSPSMKIGIFRQVLRKGPWTTQEDAMLMEYVKKNGEGNWNAVQRNSGLMRCGKSCRLRWANHLRPNLKKGAFSPEEERLILELHAKYGNKWARMATQLPGRTDNEIKNFWNTRLKRRLRAGLPIYPPDIIPQNDQEQSTQPNSSSSSHSSPLPSSSEPKSNNHNPFVSMLDVSNPLSIIKNSSHQPDKSYLSNPDHQLKLRRDNNGGLALSLLLPGSPFSATSTPLSFRSQDLSASLSLASLFDSLTFGDNPPPISGLSYNSGTGIGLVSMTSPMPLTTPSSSTNTRSDYMMGTFGEKDYHLIVPELSQGYSGLLGDLLYESRALACADKGKSVVERTNVNVHGEHVFSFGLDDTEIGKQCEDSTSEKKADKSSPEGINPVDDDFSTLLDNFPQAVLVPNWYDEIESGSNEQISSFITGDEGTTNVQPKLHLKSTPPL